MEFNLTEIYRKRRDKVVSYLKANGIEAAVFEDSEDKRDVSIRYLTGHPSDALLIISHDGQNTLVPWDENLAAQKAHADSVIPYTKYARTNTKAVKEILKTIPALSSGRTPTVAVSPNTSFILYEKYKKELADWNIECKEDSVHKEVVELRAVKDSYEIYCTKKACAITDAMTQYIYDNVKSGKIQTETDVALYIERELRANGCERTSFDTLAAGPERSFAIHAFPGYTGGKWGNVTGLSLLDFGVCYEGYASDCTITLAKGPLKKEQEELLALVQKAADECLKCYMPGKKIYDAACKADEIFKEKGRAMPHGLGHGTGLEIHEAPFVNMRAKENMVFKPGNIITLEPGLYDPILGGTRLENDVLITENGNEVLTKSKIFLL